jgi:hypothetical protein
MRSMVFAFVRVKVLKDSIPDGNFWRRPLSGAGQEYAFPAGSKPYIQAAAVFLQRVNPESTQGTLWVLLVARTFQ